MSERPLGKLLPYPSAPGANLPELDLGIGIATLRIKFVLFVDVCRKLSGEINRDDVSKALGIWASKWQIPTKRSWMC